MDRMKQLIIQAMQEGVRAIGRVVYVPNSFDTTDQMIELARLPQLRRHIFGSYACGAGRRRLARNGPDCEGAHIPTEIFHVGMSVARDPNFVRIVEQARSEGIDSRPMLTPTPSDGLYRQLIPVWAQEGNAAPSRTAQTTRCPRARGQRIPTHPGRYADYTVSSANPEFDDHTFRQIAASLHESLRNDGRLSDRHKSKGLPNRPADNEYGSSRSGSISLSLDRRRLHGIDWPAGVHTSFGKTPSRSLTLPILECGAHRHVLNTQERSAR